MVGGVVLAAGRGRRMGSPKALLEIEGIPLLVRVIRLCREGGCERVWVVLGEDMPKAERLAGEEGAVCLTNRDPDRGMFSSVLLGIEEALSAEANLTALVLFPVDHPFVSPRTIAGLLPHLDRGDEQRSVQPEFEGRPGHPLVLGRAGAQGLLGRAPTLTLREALREAGLFRTRVPCADPGVVRNCNRPQDLA